MRGAPATLLLIAGAVIVLDQVTKNLVARTAYVRVPRAFVPDLLSISYHRNPALAFQWLSTLDDAYRIVLLIVCPLVLLVGIFVLLWRMDASEPIFVRAIALIMGGGTSNVIDRIAQSAVVDFVHFGGPRGPTFNLADVAILAGAWLLLRRGFTALADKRRGLRTTPSVSARHGEL